MIEKRNTELQPFVVSVKQALELSNLGRTKLNELLKARAIRSRKAGRRRLVELPSLKEWLQSLPE